MLDAIRKAEALIEALNYIRTFRDRLTVIKLGGSAMEDPAALTATLQDVVFLETAGMRPVLVHGGGKPIDRAMAESGVSRARFRAAAIRMRPRLRSLLASLSMKSTPNVRQIRQLGGRAVGSSLRLDAGPFWRTLLLPARTASPSTSAWSVK